MKNVTVRACGNSVLVHIGNRTADDTHAAALTVTREDTRTITRAVQHAATVGTTTALYASTPGKVVVTITGTRIPKHVKITVECNDRRVACEIVPALLLVQALRAAETTANRSPLCVHTHARYTVNTARTAVTA